MDWKFADAKSRFSELVRRALIEGMQRVIRRDRAAVIAIAERECEQRTGRLDFEAFLMGDPALEDVNLKRDRTPMREAGV